MRARILALVVLALALEAAPAAAAGPLEDGARIFPFAGAGPAAPADGRQAGAVGLEALDLQPLADGSTLVLAAAENGTRLQRIDPRGRLRRVAAAGKHVRAVALAPDSGLLLVSRVDLKLRRLDLATGALRVLADLGAVARTRTPHANDVAALDDGSAVVTVGSTPLQGGAPFDEGGLTAFRVSTAGTITRAYPDVPASPQRAAGLAALPGAAFALLDLDRHVVVRVAADGALTELGPVDAGLGALAGLADGSVVGGTVFGHLARYVPGRPPQALSRVEGRSVLGNGDGGPLGEAEVSTRAIALTAAGDLLVGGSGGVRIVPAEATAVGVGAVAAPGFAGLRSGRVTLTTTRAGTATVRVAGKAGTVTSGAAQAVPAGGGAVRLARAPKPAASTVTVTFTDRVSGRVTVTSTRADTRTTLPSAEAYRAIGTVLSAQGDGDEGESVGPVVGRCERRGASRIECSVDEARTRGGRTTRTCAGRIEAVLGLGGVRTRRYAGSCDLAQPAGA